MRRVKISMFLLLWLVVSVTSEAYTTNDLREMLGKFRNDREDYKEYTDGIMSSYNSVNENNKIAKEFNKEETESELNTRNENLVALTAELNTVAISSSKVEDVMAVVSKAEEELGLIKRCESILKIGSTVSFKKNEYEEEMKYVTSLIDSIGDSVDIGYIGMELQKPIDTDYMDLVEIRGGWKFRGREDKKSYVLSQWNGTVEKIKKASDGSLKVRIRHSKALYTEMSGLRKVTVTKGTEVKQYQEIGYIGKGKSLGIKVVLDTEEINPVYLYGEKGYIAYKKWWADHPGEDFERIELDEVYIEMFKSVYSDEVKASTDDSGVSYPDWYKPPENSLIE